MFSAVHQSRYGPFSDKPSAMIVPFCFSIADYSSVQVMDRPAAHIALAKCFSCQRSTSQMIPVTGIEIAAPASNTGINRSERGMPISRGLAVFWTAGGSPWPYEDLPKSVVNEPSIWCNLPAHTDYCQIRMQTRPGSNCIGTTDAIRSGPNQLDIGCLTAHFGRSFLCPDEVAQNQG